MANEKQQAKIIFQEAPGRVNLAVSGAYGGPSPNTQMVVAHLFSEYMMVPSIQTAVIGEGGAVNMDEAQTIRRGEIMREIVATLHMSPEAAINIGKWLVDHGQTALQMRAQ